MTKRIIDGERWLAERTKFLREQLDTSDLTDNQRTLIEPELDMLLEERGVPTAGYRWPRLRRRFGRKQ